MPTPYNNQVFAALSRSEDLELIVHFQKLRRGSHPWRDVIAGNFEWRRIANRGFDRHLLKCVLDSEVFWILGGWSGCLMIAIALLRAVCGLPFAIWADTPSPHRRPWFIGLMRKGLLQVMFRCARRVLATGAPCVEALAQLGCPIEKLVLFPYWVALPAVSRVEMSTQEQYPALPVRFVAVGRLASVKRIDAILTALAQVVRRCGSGVAHLTVVGDGSERAKLEATARSLGIAKSVTWTGWQEHEAVLGHVARADVLVHAADWEPYGVVVIEAMAYGKAVIVSDGTVAGLDRVAHGRSGFVFPRGDTDALTGYMEFFVRNPGEVRSMGQSARDAAEKWPLERATEVIREVVA